MKMTNLAVIPIILPLAAGFILAFIHNRTKTKECVSLLFNVQLVLSNIYLKWYVVSNGTIVLETREWKAPYGIVIVADSLSAILVGITSIITLVLVYTSRTQITDI